jgi:dTDP-4-amino-4,6-dideoxygalactose transaminase
MSVHGLACLGNEPAFPRPLPVGQLYFPSWERYETAFRDIFDRQYYTNQGPLADRFEAELAAFLQVKHVVCVTNATIGLMMVVEAMGLKGKVILPAFTFAASAQALSWTKVTPAFCDVSPVTCQMDLDSLPALLGPEVRAIMGVNLWGGSCNPEALERFAAEQGLGLFFDSAHAFGCAVDGKPIGGFGNAEVFSFHATKVLSATEGGAVATNDDQLAARLRNIRSSYGARTPVKVDKTSNGRMSEAQAAIGLMSLADFPENRDNNERLHAMYRKGVEGVAGMEVVLPVGVSHSNYQYAVFRLHESEFGMARDQLIEALKADNVIARRYFYPGLHRCLPYRDIYPEFVDGLPNTDELCAQCIQLPLGAQTSMDTVARICELIREIQHRAAEVRSSLEGR